MKRSKQLEFFKPNPRFFGGILLHGKRKGRRPLSTKDPIHLVMRSSWAKGRTSFLKSRNYSFILNTLYSRASKYGVKIYREAIASNHIHLVLRIHNRDLYAKFIRTITSLIASHVMNGTSFKEFLKSVESTEDIQGKEQQFWQFRPFTRVLYWGRDYDRCCAYLVRNDLEAWGFIPYMPRVDWYGTG